MNESAELDALGQSEPPTGQVTFLFTDIEGSTWLVQKLGSGWDSVLEDHYRILRQEWNANNGYEVSTEGDAFFVAFASPEEALAAAVDAQRALSSHIWPDGVELRVRIGVNTGDARTHNGNYRGLAVHQAARVQSAAHGGQIIISETTRKALVVDAEDMSFVDLGLHQLKDIVSPVRLYQVAALGLESTFPPPRTLTTLTNNFPLQVTSFVGRDDDLAAVRRALDEARLVTLVGAGGVGKTRLALRVGADILGSFEGGAWLVDLAGLADRSLVASATASALGAREQPGRAVIDTLTDYLLGHRTLVILDNCEHLIGACAELAGQLLSRCPDVKILATSREAINIPGEVSWQLRSLTVPDDSDLQALVNTEAAVLFAERTRAVQAGFEVTASNAAAVAQICRRLDGMPLAIELAASRVRTMAVHEVASRLDDRFRLLSGGSRTALPRQRTLEATVAWSYELLPESERVLFDRLSVFAGGCTIESAQRVCADERVPEDQVLELMIQLADRSMLVVEKNLAGPTRYGMLESLRQFARERLLQRGEAEIVRRHHLSWAVDVAESIGDPTGPTKQHPDLVVEEQNLRAALQWAMDCGDEVSSLRIVSSAWFGHFNERVPLFERLLPPSPEVPVELAAKALWAGLALAFMMGDWELGMQRGAWGATAARAAGDALRLALCLSYQGACAWGLGADEEAARLAEQALVEAQTRNLPEGEARVSLFLAYLRMERDLDLAEEAALTAKVLAADLFTRAHADEALGFIYCLRREFARSAGQLADAVEQFKEIQANCGAHILETCAAWAAATERFELGAEILAAAERIRKETADQPRPSERAIRRDWLPLIPARMDAESFEAAQKRGRLLHFEEALDFAKTSLRAYTT